MVGVDIGQRNLAIAAPASAGPDVDEALVVDGGDVQGSLAALAGSTRSLQSAPFDTDREQTRIVATVWSELRTQLRDAADQVVAYAQRFETPALAVENVPRGHTLWEHRTSGDWGMWVLTAVVEVLTVAADGAGLPVMPVEPEYTTQQCHGCGALAEMRDETIRCTTPGCPVGSVCRDRSAAVTIARRALGGESER